MKTILCFGDSNTWGYNPNGEGRHPWDVRWTGQLQREVGTELRIVEEGLNGRTTAFDDPLMPQRNGLHALPMILDTHSPIDLLLVMLGTNDTKDILALSPYLIAEGLAALLAAAQAHENAPKRILVVAPPLLVPTDDAHINAIFSEGVEKSSAIPPLYERVARDAGCAFWNAASVAQASPLDGVHLDASAHAQLAAALTKQLPQLMA